MKKNKIDVQPISNSVGAEITGVDLGEPLTDFAYRKIRKALCEWGVIFFREQNITPDQHLNFGKKFGDLHVSKTIAKVPGYPLVGEVRKEPDQTRNIGGNWHSDHTFSEIPPLGSILVAREPLYRQAAFTVSTSDQSIEALCREIVRHATAAGFKLAK